MNILRLLVILACLMIQSVYAGALSDRYLNCNSLIYGITQHHSDRLSSETRVLKIVEEFETSKTLAGLVTTSILNPNDPTVQDWVQTSTSGSTITSSITDWAKRRTAGAENQPLLISPEVQEFHLYVGPFIATQDLNIPFTSYFDDSFTTYVKAGLAGTLKPNDLSKMKELISTNFANPDPKVTATYNLLLKFYINQTEDLDFLRQLWRDYSTQRHSILIMCAFANQDSKLVPFGVELVQEVYSSCPADEDKERIPQEGAATLFLQRHLTHDFMVNRVAAKIATNPLQFKQHQTQLLLALKGFSRIGGPNQPDLSLTGRAKT